MWGGLGRLSIKMQLCCQLNPPVGCFLINYNTQIDGYKSDIVIKKKNLRKYDTKDIGSFRTLDEQIPYYSGESVQGLEMEVAGFCKHFFSSSRPYIAGEIILSWRDQAKFDYIPSQATGCQGQRPCHTPRSGPSRAIYKVAFFEPTGKTNP